jgi:hypothetical protein
LDREYSAASLTLLQPARGDAFRDFGGVMGALFGTRPRISALLPWIE